MIIYSSSQGKNSPVHYILSSMDAIPILSSSMQNKNEKGILSKS